MVRPMKQNLNNKIQDEEIQNQEIQNGETKSDRLVPRPGERYRHFKNRLYQVLAVAVHSETGEKMVVYQALYGEFGIWVRPLSLFMEVLDRNQYPEAVQKYRFERVTDAFLTDGTEQACETSGNSEPEARANPMLLEFLDCDSYEERMAVLQRMKGRVGQREIDSICVCLDIRPSPGSLEEQLDSIKRFLKMQQRYDSSRLRRS